LTFSINVTLDGCVDHQEGIADDETHAFFTRLMDEGGAMLWGRVTYEMMESYWPAVARGDEEAAPAVREWAVKLEAKPKYVVSSTRKDFPWNNSHHIFGDLHTGVQKLKEAIPAGVLLGVASSQPSWTGWIRSTSTSSSSTPGLPATARPCTRAGCPAREGSSWSRRSRSAAARSLCTTDACADSERPHRVQLAVQRVVGSLLAAPHGVPATRTPS
jgi:hypothetical protein